MDRLSTELDEKIIQHLVGKEASALSMTSKYYRSLAEPQLYRELNFSTKQCIDLMLLFDTLVDRQDLAKHIHSFTITTNGIPQFTLAFDAVFFSRFQSKINEYERVIREVIPSSSRSRARQWLDRMHLGEPMIDGQLAMIACLAGNMEHLTLGGVYPSSLPITLSVLEKSWDKVSAGFLSSEGSIIRNTMEEYKAKYAIHEACREGQTSRVDSLLAANPKLANLRDPDDRLPIHWAVSYNHLAIVQTLVQSKSFDPDVTDGSGWTPLMMACSRKDAEPIVDLLLSKDADVNAKNNNGQTALHFCASKVNLDIARTLLAQKPPASARIKDKRGQLPLHRAAAVGSVPMMKALLDAKSPLNATDMDGMTALHHAMSEGHGDAALLLLTMGAEHDKKDTDGHVALDLAPDAKTRSFILQAAEREGIELQ
ncbi:hypothetical protein J4E93_010691 [Alternaria ventricosa]|uniref:uncharacterized protein n=1 Tax=Alternaria ventricosa TaxID=1187951 RepID=UPI0020C53DDF|nr:uncharacterized protein J4E93_010691 [Alternaria ventricosa]KAI4637025.1 hypothetical protein J4E93_010691 [Alternaria ventricosa]